MLALRKLNNNVVLCRDADGRDLVAMGKGLGFGTLPREVSIKEIERTFYDVNPRFLATTQTVSPEIMDVAIRIGDMARNKLPYAVSSNVVFTLADHIEFALERAEKNLVMSMPLSYDVEQSYPLEYEIGQFAVRRIRHDLKASIPTSEATGIALNIVNARMDDGDVATATQSTDDDMLEDVIAIIEDETGVMIDRGSFAFSRFATHMGYLFQRLHAGEDLDSGVNGSFRDLLGSYPEMGRCVEAIAEHVDSAWATSLSDDEKLYLVLHVSRLCAKEGRNG
ncbi:MAG: PRD domain-containing protein [Atopobiaceae bacterium]|jgi:beta-glucoside operon transcriptional antiterminator|nr:PRD domain-containing protein [Atopobiaceae bacterium]